MDAEKRHRGLYRFLRQTAGRIVRRMFGLTNETVPVEHAPYLVLANHNTDLDPALIAMSFPEQMYFVASEHVFRKGFASRLLQYWFAPISRVKGATDAVAAMDIIRTLRKGKNVCLFAEGNRSFNGVTGPIFPATGKLCKVSGAALITYKFEGGYLTTPRWAYTRRKGRMRGYCVNQYSPAQLKAMTADEVNAAIERDLYEDAFLRQRLNPCAYRGRRLAEGLENALFICPKCGRIDTLQSKDDRFFCDCGLSVRYTETGFFEGDGAPFATVLDWDNWQQARLTELIETMTEETALSDEGMVLSCIAEGVHRDEVVAKGRMRMSRTKLSIGTWALPVSAISDMAQVGKSRVLFSADGKHYEIDSERPYYCGRKYFLFYQQLQAR